MLFLFVAFFVSAVILGALLYRKYEQSRHAPSTPPPAKEAGTIIVTLFFADQGGNGLRREAREIDVCDELSSCADAVVEEIMNGPVSELAPTLPGTFSYHDIKVTGDTAVIDLDRGALEGLPEGSSAEMSAVYSIVDSITFNFPQIRRVQFLMDGAALSTAKGHLDLREPLPPDYSLETK